MDRFTIELVNQTFSVSVQYPSSRDYCASYLTEKSGEIMLSISQLDIEFERSIGISGIGTKEPFGSAFLETVAIQRKITEHLLNQEVLLFHGSAVAVDGEAYLFTAKSGTGKSTHTRLWREMLGDRAVMVNDDKPFLQMTENGVVAWGSPWNGKHRLGNNIGVPLKSICLLERSTDNWINPIGIAEALPMLFQQSQRPQNPANLAKYMELVDKLANSVEFYRMGCNMDPEAALVSYEAMSRGRKDD